MRLFLERENGGYFGGVKDATHTFLPADSQVLVHTPLALPPAPSSSEISSGYWYWHSGQVIKSQ